MNLLMKLLADNRGKGIFRAETTGNEATLYLYDAIVSDDYWGGVSATSFVKALSDLKGKNVHLRINSPGGDVFAAQAMAQAIREHGNKVIAHIDGYAASAASFIAIAADEVVISEGGFFMIHKASTIAFGDANALKETAALLEKVDATLVASYAKETGQDAQQIADWMTAETWFNAEESVANGFADSIAGPAPKAQATWNLSAYTKAPKAQAITPPHNDINPRLNSRQVALVDAVEDVVESFGPLDQSSGPDGAHYMPAADNPFGNQGLKCANCVQYEGGRACEWVSGDIDPDALCKFWIIPQDLLVSPASNAATAHAVVNTEHLRRRLKVMET